MQKQPLLAHPAAGSAVPAHGPFGLVMAVCHDHVLSEVPVFCSHLPAGITEWFGLGDTLKHTHFQVPWQGQGWHQQIRLHRAPPHLGGIP